MTDSESPKIHIDSDWKAQAQAEKERLSAEAEQKTDTDQGAGGMGEMPPANFETLIGTFVTQALFALGAIPDPRTGQPSLSLDLARHNIDMLTVVSDKTKGNLSKEEEETLATTLYELRNRYVQISQAARQQ
ncbi:hypothetical protein KS4_22900 [Poriferisphaera corsica]|uniref:DUF1844 domain-containing protein n=1 Tax=Poriferisphaera corsica TaxID=2528020 RepID=A0A517YVG7_9BACT|nr:DUF1844 domain-containing protein [Poriferisphaera corsica]QDU34225.1 hypothetical protein KS4_22900 [Poriferisphaera corsica]